MEGKQPKEGITDLESLLAAIDGIELGEVGIFAYDPELVARVAEFCLDRSLTVRAEYFADGDPREIPDVDHILERVDQLVLAVFDERVQALRRELEERIEAAGCAPPEIIAPEIVAPD